MIIVRLVVAALLALAALPSAARIVAIEVKRTEAFAGGKGFGTHGSYVKVVGVAKGELDPTQFPALSIRGSMSGR